MSSLLLAWVLVLTPQQSGQQSEQQRQELRQIQQQLQLQQEELERVTELLEEQQAKPLCLANIRLVNDSGPVGLGLEASLPLNLFSTTSRPREDCLPAEIRLTASYFDRTGNLICSGVIRDAATQRGLTESINLEIRPWNLIEFVRWINESQTVGAPKNLVCVSPDGLTRATSIEPGLARSLLIHSTLLPEGGGLSTAEFRINLLP